jgi:hypothetical protein
MILCNLVTHGALIDKMAKVRSEGTLQIIFILSSHEWKRFFHYYSSKQTNIHKYTDQHNIMTITQKRE